MSLRFDNVCFRYPGSKVGVADISLEIADGELLTLIGASGSGKSTILKLLSGFVRPDSGRVLIDGNDVTELPPEARRLGVVFQSYALFPHMKLWENISYPLKVRKVARPERYARALEMLRRVGIEDRADDYPAALSGGQQQRVALARALVFEPRGLLLDEPLSALDAGLRVEMRDEIRRVQRGSGVPTLFVTHDQEEALCLGDRVAVMREGRIVQVGAPRELYEAPVNADIAAFVGQSNLWPAKVAAPGRVETALGPLSCDTGIRMPGEAVTILVRPERVEPIPAEMATGIGSFRGKVIADRYLGPVRRIDLTVEGGVIRLETHRREPVSAVTVPPDAVCVLPSS